MYKSVSLKKNALLNIVKQILSIAFPLITFPYVSRVFLETNLGKYYFSLSVVSYFCLIAGMGVKPYGVREIARVRNDRAKCEELSCELFTINILTSNKIYFTVTLFSRFLGLSISLQSQSAA